MKDVLNKCRFIISTGIPLWKRQKEGSLQYLGASEKADIMDVARVVVDDIKELQRYLKIYHCPKPKDDETIH